MSEQDGLESPASTSSPSSEETTSTQSLDQPEESEVPTSTPDSITKESFETLQQAVIQQGEVLKTLPDAIRSTVTSIVGAVAPPPREPAPEPEPEVTDDDFMTAPTKNTEVVADKLFRKRIKPLVPYVKNQSEQLFNIQYDLARRDEPELFEKLKPHMDEYFEKNPDAKQLPNAVATVMTHYKGVFSKELIQEAVEKSKETPVVKPTPTGGGKPPKETKKTSLNADEKYAAAQLGLSEEDFLESYVDLKSSGRI